MKSTIATITLFAANALAQQKIYWEDPRAANKYSSTDTIENKGYTAWEKLGDQAYDFEVGLGLELLNGENFTTSDTLASYVCYNSVH